MAQRCRILTPEYAVYDKQDQLVFIGNSDETAEFVGFSGRKVLHSQVSRQESGIRQWTRTGYKISRLGVLDDEEMD